MMKLYFVDVCDKEKLIGFPITLEKGYNIIEEYCKNAKFKIFETKGWFDEDGNIKIDVGACGEFFIIKP